MTQEEAFEYIDEINQLGSVPGLETITELLRRLDNPQNKLKVIHIAGTNGKGSIGAFLDNILETAGCMVGRYLSPSVDTYLERFQINKEYMSKEEFPILLEPVKQAADEMVQAGFHRPTSFETETAVSFLYFLNKKVDIVLLETGMGGKSDATNVVERPFCTIIASISMDHMQFLGDTKEKILKEKLGIMRKGVPCIAYELENSLKEYWVKKCEKMQCPMYITTKKELYIEKSDETGSEFQYKGKQYRLPVPGIYQIYNSLVAIETVRAINDHNGLKCVKNKCEGISHEMVQAGLEKTYWRGRFQIISRQPMAVVDGAHNEGGWIALKESIQRYFAGRDMIYVCGVFADKEYGKLVDIMSPLAEAVITVTPDNKRALSKEVLADEFRKRGTASYINTAENVMEAWDLALETAKDYQNPVIIVFGSLSFIGPLIYK